MPELHVVKEPLKGSRKLVLANTAPRVLNRDDSIAFRVKAGLDHARLDPAR
jgi:hypothetical protein